MNFSELDINTELIEALAKNSIKAPTPIQEKAIPQFFNDKDLIMVSETGTGKTLAYLLPVLQKIDVSINNNQVLILAPTHELAGQINNEIQSLIKAASLPFNSLLAIGEANIKRQIEALKKKPPVITGTPGRINDLIDRKKIKTHTIKTIIFDEADALINSEHKTTIETIIKKTSKECRLIFVSATMCDMSRSFISKISSDINNITIDNSSVLSDDIKHIFIHTSDKREKINILRKTLHAIAPAKTIIFVKTNIDVADLGERLRHHKISAIEISGDNKKLERQKTMRDFKSGIENILISSDISARGLDVQDVTHIINYNVPASSGEYRHRAGRTGRSGKKGIAVTITAGNEKKAVKKFEDELHITIKEKKLRDGKLIE